MSSPTPLRLPRVRDGAVFEPKPAPEPDENAALRARWGAGVERIVLMILQQEIRTLGVTGAGPGIGASAVSRLTAEFLARTGHGSLHLDLSTPIGVVSDWPAWPSPQVDPRPWIVEGADGPSRLLARPTEETRDQFHDMPRLRRLFTTDVFKAHAIVLDLPPLAGCARNAINPLGAAAACDAVVLVCGPGRTTRQEMTEAVAACQSSRINLVGLVINDLESASLAEEIGATGRRLFRFVPPLARWIESRALRSEILR